MLVLEGYKVKISRGDSYSISISIDGYAPEGSSAIAAVAKVAGGTPLWQISVPVTDNLAIFNLTTEQTGISAGKYVWDVRIVLPDGAVKTVFTPAMFQVVEVVANA